MRATAAAEGMLTEASTPVPRRLHRSGDATSGSLSHTVSVSVTVNFDFLLMEHVDAIQLVLKRRRWAVACDF